MKYGKFTQLPQAVIERRIQITGQLAQVSYLLFIAILIANFHQLYRPTQVSHWLVGVAQLIPILLFAPAFFKLWRKGILGFCFVLMLYFCFTIINMGRPIEEAWLSYAELIIEVTLLYAALNYGKYINVRKLQNMAQLDTSQQPLATP